MAGKPLTNMSDNVHMLRISKAIGRADEFCALPGKVGDFIDHGLIYLRFLNEAGYDLVPRSTESENPGGSDGR